MHLPSVNTITILFRCSEHERRAVVGLLVVLVALVFTYSYFVTASVVNVVVRKDIEQRIAATRTDVGELETRYIHAKNTVDRAYAQEQGYVATEAAYVTRAPLARTDNAVAQD